MAEEIDLNEEEEQALERAWQKLEKDGQKKEPSQETPPNPTSPPRQ